jgi:hypothetical protein
MAAAGAARLLDQRGIASDKIRVTLVNRDDGIAARSLGLRLHVRHAGKDTDIGAAFAGFVQVEAGVLVITTDAFFIGMTNGLQS